MDYNKFKKFWQKVFRYLTKKEVFFNASAITFNIFLCAIPFTLLLFSLIGYILSYEAAFQEIIRYGKELFPEFNYESQSNDVVKGAVTLESILNPLINNRQAFGLYGFGALIVFSQALFHTLKDVVFFVFDIEDRKHPVIELIHNFFTFGLVGGVFLFFSIVISIVSLISIEGFVLPLTDVTIWLGWMFDTLNIVIPLAFTFLLLYIIFRYISEKRLSRHTALFGATLYTILFEVAKFGLGLYLENAVVMYRYLYQGYTIAIVILVWAFYSAVIFVITTILARSYEETYKFDKRKIPYNEIS